MSTLKIQPLQNAHFVTVAPQNNTIKDKWPSEQGVGEVSLLTFNALLMNLAHPECPLHMAGVNLIKPVMLAPTVGRQCVQHILVCV